MKTESNLLTLYKLTRCRNICILEKARKLSQKEMHTLDINSAVTASLATRREKMRGRLVLVSPRSSHFRKRAGLSIQKYSGLAIPQG